MNYHLELNASDQALPLPVSRATGFSHEASPEWTKPHYLQAIHLSVLHEIRTKGINLCIWQRENKPYWHAAIETILTNPRSLALDLTAPTPTEVAEQLCSFLGVDSYAAKFSLTSFGTDVATLAVLFATVSGVKRPRLRLTREEDGGCVLFHPDTPSLRMICTYAGPGTQWLENDNVRRQELGSRGRSHEAATDAAVIDPARIRTISTGHVVLFKGQLWPGEEENALIHRSPPIHSRGDYRILLRVDPSDLCSC
jgi:hypothetical protein